MWCKPSGTNFVVQALWCKLCCENPVVQMLWWKLCGANFLARFSGCAETHMPPGSNTQWPPANRSDKQSNVIRNPPRLNLADRKVALARMHKSPVRSMQLTPTPRTAYSLCAPCTRTRKPYSSLNRNEVHNCKLSGAICVAHALRDAQQHTCRRQATPTGRQLSVPATRAV